MFSPEFQILLLSLRLDDQLGAVIEAQRIIDGNQIDWEDLYRRADIHYIKPQLAQLVGKVSPVVVPESFKEKINGASRQNLVNQLRYADEFFRIRDLFKEAGIQVIPFKGFWLAHDAYGNLADRESLDVDVFVNIGDLESIRTLMEENGYRAEEAFRDLTVEEIRRGFQEYNFDRVDGETNVFHIEFHWGICPPDYGMGITLEDLRSQVTTDSLQGRELQVFTPSAHLLLALLHHGGKDRFILLKQIHDVAQIVYKHDDINWNWVVSEAGRLNAVPLVYVGVNLASALTGVAIPPEIKSRTEKRKIKRLTENRLGSMMRAPDLWHNRAFNFNNWLFRMRSRTGLTTKMKITAATCKVIFARFFRGQSNKEENYDQVPSQ